MNISIRYATQKDAQLIAELSHQTFYETFASQNSEEDMRKFLTQQFTKGKLMLEVGAPGNIFILAYVNNEIAGYAKLREDTAPKSMGQGPSMEIARLYAVTHMIGKGVGKKLMQSCIDIAIEKGKELLWLGVWEKNFRALNFYLSWGFEKFDETIFVLGDDIQHDWLMRKCLRKEEVNNEP